ncbi:TPA: hypothetical protein ACKRTE_000923 [Providencia rettgeri]
MNTIECAEPTYCSARAVNRGNPIIPPMATVINGTKCIFAGSYVFLHRPQITPLAMLAPETTFYIAGFLKNVATGLRVSVVLLPIQFIENIEKTICITTWNTPALITAIICDWIEKGEVA